MYVVFENKLCKNWDLDWQLGQYIQMLRLLTIQWILAEIAMIPFSMSPLVILNSYAKRNKQDGQHLDLSRCPLLHKSLQPPILLTG